VDKMVDNRTIVTGYCFHEKSQDGDGYNFKPLKSNILNPLSKSYNSPQKQHG
jgi:hypothetical protein